MPLCIPANQLTPTENYIIKTYFPGSPDKEEIFYGTFSYYDDERITANPLVIFTNVYSSPTPITLGLTTSYNTFYPAQHQMDYTIEGKQSVATFIPNNYYVIYNPRHRRRKLCVGRYINTTKERNLDIHNFTDVILSEKAFQVITSRFIRDELPMNSARTGVPITCSNPITESLKTGGYRRRTRTTRTTKTTRITKRKKNRRKKITRHKRRKNKN
jgi:hypothetical protein